MPSGRLEPGLVQVAGVRDAAEAALLVACGVRHLGFPLGLDVHEEDLPPEEAACVIATLPPGVEAVLITYQEGARGIADLCARLGCGIVQVHGRISLREIRGLRGLTVIKSLVVGRDEDLEGTVREFAPFVDAFLTDTFDAATGASGATGRTHDWRISRRLVEISPRPVILAGGLTPGNVRQAILEVRPAGVDSHTGVEGPDGRKDRAKVERFVREARAAFAAPGRGG